MADSENDPKYEGREEYSIYVVPSPKEVMQFFIEKVTRVKELSASPKYKPQIPRPPRKKGGSKKSAKNRYEDYDITPTEICLDVIIMELKDQLEIMERVGGLPRQSIRVMDAMGYLTKVPLLTIMMEELNKEMIEFGIVEKIIEQPKHGYISVRRRRKEKETSHTPKELNNGALEEAKTSASGRLTWCQMREIRYYLQRQKVPNQAVLKLLGI